MEQKNKNSIGLQVDTINMEISIEQVETIVKGLFYDNFIKLREEANEIVENRLSDFSKKMFEQFLLIKMLSDKIKTPKETNYSLMLGQALELIPKLSSKHINLLSLATIFKNLNLGSLNLVKLPRDEEKFKQAFNIIFNFIDKFEITIHDINYLTNYGIGTFLLGDKLDELLIKNYPNMFDADNSGKLMNEPKYANINGERISVREYIESLDQRYSKIFYVFDDLDLYLLNISPIAEIIGLLNYSIITKDLINLNKMYL